MEESLTEFCLAVNSVCAKYNIHVINLGIREFPSEILKIRLLPAAHSKIQEENSSDTFELLLNKSEHN